MPDSRWPREMSLEENLGERHARDFDERMGFTYTVLDDSATWSAASTSIRRETASTTPTFSRGCARRVPSLDLPLREAIARLARDWPFERPLYAPLLG